MAFYRLVLTRDAKADLRRLPFPFRRQINQRLFALKSNPRLEGAEQLSETESFRLPASGWRLLYSVSEGTLTVTVHRVVR